ncbi:MAG: hypothetical protein ACOYK8_02040 [Alphaproteobacteria bacterium]
MRKILLLTILFFAVSVVAQPLSSMKAQASEEKSDGHGEEKGGHDKEDPNEPHYVHFQQRVIIPMFSGKNIVQVVALQLALEVNTSSQADKVRNMFPRLQNAYLETLYGNMDNSNIISDTGRVNLGFIKSQIAVASEKILGEGVLKDVLIQSVSQREM